MMLAFHYAFLGAGLLLSVNAGDAVALADDGGCNVDTLENCNEQEKLYIEMWSAMPYEAQKMRTEDMQRKKSKGKLKEKDIEKLELMQKVLKKLEAAQADKPPRPPMSEADRKEMQQAFEELKAEMGDDALKKVERLASGIDDDDDEAASAKTSDEL